ncbi:MAG: bifunctional 5,10-methylenetetrahydrofolate dehydrogenase/5,10-methenyltetrahydrofolate cyclohydrolase [Parcubacteria group bacterium]|jgi:methylenetetrahydrofolate dehydrogenase (NADP+)/methenyltetrahydrofolate cyclohydrolase
MKLLNGKKISEKILLDLTKKVKKAKKKPFLAVIMIGENEASEIYVSLKEKKAKIAGIGFKLYKFNNDASQGLVIDLIKKLNADSETNGIIVQLPLPGKFNTQKIINTINPEKDVDGFHPENIKLFLKGKERFFPVFPQAIMEAIESSKKKFERKKAVVVANSKLFGEMMLKALERKKIKGEYILKKDVLKNSSKIKKADILITAIGSKGIIKGETIKSGAIVIDGGISKKNGKVFGDVDFESAKKIAGFLTPVPGGVGPVTVACLLNNVLEAFKNQNKI